MTRSSERERVGRSFSVVLQSWAVVAIGAIGLLGSVAGCDQLDARNRIRKGNRLFRETQFIDAVSEYQYALRILDHPIVHYNLGLAYSKVFKPGYDGPVLLGLQGDFACQQLPNVKVVQAGACVKEGDRHFAECGKAKTAPIEKEIADLQSQLKDATDDDKKKEIKSLLNDKEQDLGRYTCSSSFRCVEGPFCSLTSPELADLAAQHFQLWIKTQASDDEIKKELVAVSEELDAAKKADNKPAISDAQRRVDELQTKDQTRKQMTLLWTDSEQYRKALDYWESLLRDKPNDPEIMGVLAGISLKAGDWRKSIEWYNKVADVTTDPSSKVAAYQFIGNVAWSKLNSRTLIGTEAIELADRGLGALQHAIEVQPQNPKPWGLAASLFNFRSTAHGASFAAAIDRASQQDLLKLTRVLLDEAKKAQGQAPGSPPAAGAGSASAPTGSQAPGAPGAPGTPATPSAGTGSAAAPAAGAPAAPSGGAAAPPPAGAAAPAGATAPAGAAAPAPSAPKTTPAPAPPAPSSGGTPTPPATPPAAPEKPAEPAAPAPPAPDKPAEPPATPPTPPASGDPAQKPGG